MRHEYVLSLPAASERVSAPERATLSLLEPADHEALAQLMLDAYRGTIDYEGETIVEARHEVGSVFDDGVLSDASLGLRIGDELVSAIVTIPWEDAALIGFVMTHPDFKGRGFGSYLVDRCVDALTKKAFPAVHAFITEGNVASETVFLRAGFERVGETSNPQ